MTSRYLETGVQHLYRWFDADGNLLYIGISTNAYGRAKEHKRTAEWWPDAASMTLETYPTREAVQAAEKSAVAAESPRYNTHYKVKPKLSKREYDALGLVTFKQIIDALQRGVREKNPSLVYRTRRDLEARGWMRHHTQMLVDWVRYPIPEGADREDWHFAIENWRYTRARSPLVLYLETWLDNALWQMDREFEEGPDLDDLDVGFRLAVERDVA